MRQQRHSTKHGNGMSVNVPQLGLLYASPRLPHSRGPLHTQPFIPPLRPGSFVALLPYPPFNNYRDFPFRKKNDLFYFNQFCDLIFFFSSYKGEVKLFSYQKNSNSFSWVDEHQCAFVQQISHVLGTTSRPRSTSWVKRLHCLQELQVLLSSSEDFWNRSQVFCCSESLQRQSVASVISEKLISESPDSLRTLIS